MFNEKHEKVSKPNWGSFRKFWNDCELTITPVLRGFIDVEGGHVGIANDWKKGCFECINSTDCEICGRNPNNYLQVRAGDGDGAYAVYGIKFEQENVGGMIVLDEQAQMVPAIISEIDAVVGNSNVDFDDIESFYQNFYNYFYAIMDSFDPNLTLLKIGEIELKKNDLGIYENTGVMVIGESGEGIDSDQSLITLSNLKIGQYRFFCFANREKSNSNIIVPRMVLFLRSDASDSIGLTSEFAQQLNLEDEIENWSNSIVMGRIGEPLAPAIIKANLDWLQINLWTDVIKGEGNFDPVINKYTQLEYFSWILLLYHHVEAEAFRNHAKEIFKENQKSLKDLHILRGQFERKIY